MKSRLSGTILLLSVFGSLRAAASACCGSHAAIPSLITGYETARLNAAFSQATVIGDVYRDGRSVFRNSTDRTVRSSLKLAGSYAFADRWQAGAALPIGLGSQLGDTDALVAFEIQSRPDLLSSAPKLLGFVQVTAPTGRSADEAGLANEGQITGGGFYRLGVGALAVVTRRRWDFFAMPKASVGFARSFATGVGAAERTIEPGWIADAAVGVGYSFNPDWRLGSSLSATLSEARRVREADGTGATASSSLFWPLELSLAWFYDLRSTIALSYVDDTVVGQAWNSVLSRSISLQYSFRWDAQ